MAKTAEPPTSLSAIELIPRRNLFNFPIKNVSMRATALSQIRKDLKKLKDLKSKQRQWKALHKLRAKAKEKLSIPLKFHEKNAVLAEKQVGSVLNRGPKVN